jgi:hypothetical protein
MSLTIPPEIPAVVHPAGDLAIMVCERRASAIACSAVGQANS